MYLKSGVDQEIHQASSACAVCGFVVTSRHVICSCMKEVLSVAECL